MQVFDRTLLQSRRDRAARNIGEYDFLLQDVAAQLMDRLGMINRRFPRVLDVGCHHGILSNLLQERAGTENVIAADLSRRMVESIAAHDSIIKVVADEESLPFAPNSFDAVTSNLSLHWVNDLPGTLLQIRNALRPDGLFLAALLGGESLKELRECMMEAEIDIYGGVSPRISPLLDMRDMGALLQRAGFALPVVDNETITVSYSHPLRLMRDLRGMGASNAVIARLRKPARKAFIFKTAELYLSRFGDSQGRVPATFQIIYAIGWSPHDSQQKPLRPGSARLRLADALNTHETEV